MDRVADGTLDLLSWNRKRLGRAIQQEPDPIAGRAQLPHAIESR